MNENGRLNDKMAINENTRDRLAVKSGIDVAFQFHKLTNSLTESHW